MHTATFDEVKARCANLSDAYPGRRFAIARDNTAVGIWIDEQSRFVEIMMSTICDDCPWVWLVDANGNIQTNTINGRPVYQPDDWSEPTHPERRCSP